MSEMKKTKTAFSALAMLCAIGIGQVMPAHAHEGLPPGHGHLFLVSTGTGDLDNMTIRAHKVITQADIVFTMQPEGADKRYGDLLKGKKLYPAGHGLFWKRDRAENDNRKADGKAERAAKHAKGKEGDKDKDNRRRHEDPAKLEAQARKVIREAVGAGRNVVVLDNGDPLVYGPHSGYLKEFEDLKPIVVPGISSFNAANAALQRGVIGGEGRAVILTSSKGGAGNSDHVKKLAESRSSMVFFMNRSIPELVAELKTSYPGDTPIAIVADAGFRKEEKVIKATLDTIVGQLGPDKLPFAHLVYVGDFLR
ncbi:MAG: hypothetical protein K4305_06915 [Chlorobium sp.]|uniref:SAM-dependent methyltransferase n=1 Tax=Chlorobium sp. TaxID=1095 RepID=UPI002F419B39